LSQCSSSDNGLYFSMLSAVLLCSLSVHFYIWNTFLLMYSTVMIIMINVIVIGPVNRNRLSQSTGMHNFVVAAYQSISQSINQAVIII